MSLEQHIAALVSAANNLTGAVNGKMDEIDEAVQAAVEAIPELHKEIYVSSDTGNDNNLGDKNTPLKTIKEAVSRIPENGSGRINLERGQVHEINENISYESKTISFWGYGNASLPMPEILLGSYKYPESDWSEAFGLRAKNRTTVKVVECVVDTGSLATDTTTHRDSPCGLVSRDHFSGNTALIDLSLFNSEIKLRDHPLTTAFGMIRIVSSAVDINMVGACQTFARSGLFELMHQTVTISDGSIPMDTLYLGVNAERSNVLSNFAI